MSQLWITIHTDRIFFLIVFMKKEISLDLFKMNKDDVKIKKTAYISPEIKQYQMQKDTAYVIINEQLIGMKGQTINRQKIHSAKKNFTYKWKQLGDDGVLTPTDLKFKK